MPAAAVLSMAPFLPPSFVLCPLRGLSAGLGFACVPEMGKKDVPFPLPRPIKNRATNACTRLVDVPQRMKQNMTLIRPIRMVGLRPILSESRPHGTAHRLCDTEKVDPTRPAHFATLLSGMPKLLIISGR